MSFFDEYADNEGGAELKTGEFMDRISFSGKDGEYSWKEGEETKSAATLEKVIVFWHLGGQTLFGGNGSLPSDGAAPWCRNENKHLDTAVLRSNLQPSSLALLGRMGYTGDCATCPLARFQGNEKPLCAQSATIYVVDPSVATEDINEKSIHCLTFKGAAVVKALKAAIANLTAHAKSKGAQYSMFTAKFGKKKVKHASGGYCEPTIEVSANSTQAAEWVATLGVFAREALEESRKRPSNARAPMLMLASPAMHALPPGNDDAEVVDGIEF